MDVAFLMGLTQVTPTIESRQVVAETLRRIADRDLNLSDAERQQLREEASRQEIVALEGML